MPFCVQKYVEKLAKGWGEGRENDKVLSTGALTLHLGGIDAAEQQVKETQTRTVALYWCFISDKSLLQRRNQRLL